LKHIYEKKILKIKKGVWSYANSIIIILFNSSEKQQKQKTNGKIIKKSKTLLNLEERTDENTTSLTNIDLSKNDASPRRPPNMKSCSTYEQVNNIVLADGSFTKEPEIFLEVNKVIDGQSSFSVLDDRDLSPSSSHILANDNNLNSDQTGNDISTIGE